MNILISVITCLLIILPSDLFLRPNHFHLRIPQRAAAGRALILHMVHKQGNMRAPKESM